VIGIKHVDAKMEAHGATIELEDVGLPDARRDTCAPGPPRDEAVGRRPRCTDLVGVGADRDLMEAVHYALKLSTHIEPGSGSPWSS
jgi:hypothetical protein